jgi:hypothetical protein
VVEELLDGLLVVGDALVQRADDFGDSVQLVDELLQAGRHYLGQVLS